MRRMMALLVLLALALAGCTEGHKANPLPSAADMPLEPLPPPRQPLPPPPY